MIGWLIVLLLSGQLNNALVAYRAAQAIGDYNKQRAYHQGKRLGSNAKAAMVVRYRMILSCAGLLCAQNLSVTVVSAQGFTQPKNYIPSEAISKLAATYLKGDPIESEVALITAQQAEEADYNLNPGRWVSGPSSEDLGSITQIVGEFERLTRLEARSASQLRAWLRPLVRAQTEE